MNAILKKQDRYGLPGHYSWQRDYDSKLCTSDDAAKHVRSGDKVYLGGGTGIPAAFANSMGKRSDEIRDITVYQGFAMGYYEYMKPEHRKSFSIETLFVGPMERFCMDQGVAQYIPCHLGDISAGARERKINTVAFVVTPPDENGFMNRSCFGAFCPHDDLIMKADRVIVEINNNTPWLASDDFLIHVSEVDHIIENDQPMFVLPEIPITVEEEMIAAHIAGLIPDGATIQLGIGGLANAIGNLLMEKKDLGMHAELVTPSVMRLVEAGVINGSRKSFMPGKIVSAFAVGTEKFYEYINRNENFCFRDISYVNDPHVIGKNDGLVSINNALMIDLTGQVASESIGTKQYSGTGGQVNFVQGAKMSKGGKSVISINSTFKDREGNLRSKINPTLPEGTVVTTSRNDVEYIVTEFGIANLRHQSISTRVRELIKIAHPDFRERLAFDARKHGWL